jgi:Domain of unknown function (DUF4439)
VTTDPITDGLQRVLDAQHLAVYGYPVIGVQLADPAEVAKARQLQAAHRLARDAVAGELVSRQASPDASAPGYPPPAPVTDRATAIGWAVRIEESSAAAYRYLLGCAVRAGGDQTPVRRQALTGLTDAATAAAYWRGLAVASRPTVPFPGVS